MCSMYSLCALSKQKCLAEATKIAWNRYQFPCFQWYIRIKMVNKNVDDYGLMKVEAKIYSTNKMIEFDHE